MSNHIRVGLGLHYHKPSYEDYLDDLMPAIPGDFSALLLLCFP